MPTDQNEREALEAAGRRFDQIVRDAERGWINSAYGEAVRGRADVRAALAASPVASVNDLARAVIDTPTPSTPEHRPDTSEAHTRLGDPVASREGLSYEEMEAERDRLARELLRAQERLCGVVSASGPNGEPLACGYLPDHDGPHSWASLPSFPVASREVKGETRKFVTCANCPNSWFASESIVCRTCRVGTDAWNESDAESLLEKASEDA